MKTPWVNLLLLILLLVQTVSGYFGMTGNREAGAWVLVVHGIAAYGLLLLMLFKAGVILDAWRRRKRWTAERVAFLVALLLLLAVLILGLLWTFAGPIYWGGFSLVSLHIYVAVPLMLLILWHSWRKRYIYGVRGATGRRLFLGGLLAAVGGFLLRTGGERLKASVDLPGASRRFTGSYEAGSFTTAFPVVSWIADRPPPVDVAAWSLRVDGAVERPVILTYDEVRDWPRRTLTATLDCTGGWYATQHWRGLSVGDLLEQAGIHASAASVTVESVTGYRRRYPIEEARGFLLALGTLPADNTEVDGALRSLSHGHGFPLRLVAPNRRGVEWVKWVTLIRLNTTGPLWQSPLPLQ